MSDDDSMDGRLTREAALLTALVLFGMAILPAIIYVIGHAVFGDYGGGGLIDFYARLLGRFLAGEPVVWFLLLSPYVIWQTLRIALRGWQRGQQSSRPPA